MASPPCGLGHQTVTAGHLAWCRIIMLTGHRLEELHRLQPSWVNGSLLIVLAAASKTRESRAVPPCEETIEIIARWAPLPRNKPNKSLWLASKNAGFRVAIAPRDLGKFSIFVAYRPHMGGHTQVGRQEKRNDFNARP
jgi:hypothetical protein